MIDNNNCFNIKKLKNIVLLGQSQCFSKLQEINKKLNLKDIIVTCSHQKKLFSREKNVHVFDDLSNKFKNFVKKKFDLTDTLFVSIGCRWIFKKSDLNNFFCDNLVNFHGTRLPYDAGGGGFSWKILRNDRINNFIVHLIEPGIDKGRILMNEKSLFPSSCKIPRDFEEYYYNNLPYFYEKFLKKILRSEKIIPKIQVNYIGRYNPRLNTSISGWIDWKMPSEDLSKFINAFDDPYLGASTMINGKVVRLKDVHLHGGDTPNHNFMSGIISRHDKDWLVVSTIDKNMLIVEKINDLKGNNIIKKLKNGERFYTPSSKLDLAFSKKIGYNSKGLILKNIK